MASLGKISALGRQNTVLMLRAYCTGGSSKGTGSQQKPVKPSASSSTQQYHNEKRTYGADNKVDMAFYDREIEALPFRIKQPSPNPGKK